MPLIKVDVYTSARGIIKSRQERIQLFPIQSGKVIFSTLTNYEYVAKGDTLLVIENAINEEKKKLIRKQIKLTILFISDVNKLLSDELYSTHNLKTQRFMAEYNVYQQGLNDFFTKYKKIKNEPTLKNIFPPNSVLSGIFKSSLTIS